MKCAARLRVRLHFEMFDQQRKFQCSQAVEIGREIHCLRLETDPDGHARERGAAAAKRLAEAGLYQQMELVGRSRDEDLDGDAAFEAYGRSLRLITTLSGSLLNFGRFAVEVDPDHPDRYCIEIHEADDVPEVLAHTTEGFINAMAEMAPAYRSYHGRMWKLEQSGGRIRYRMTRAF